MVEPRLPIIRKHFLSKAFAESNPTTHPELWDSLLVLTNGASYFTVAEVVESVAVTNPAFIEFPQAWVNSEKKPPFPKLLNALRNGLNGSPAIAYPSMLALLANLPKEVKLKGFFRELNYLLWQSADMCNWRLSRIIKLMSMFLRLSGLVGWVSTSTGRMLRYLSMHLWNAQYIWQRLLGMQLSHIPMLNIWQSLKLTVCGTCSKRIESAEEADKVRSYLIHEQFGKVIKLYFAATSTDRITQKLDPASISLVISKHLISLSSIQSLKGMFSVTTTLFHS